MQCNHVTGKFRGAAHNACNLNLNPSKLSQSERVYDSHLIMQAIKKIKNKQLNCILQSHADYKAFFKGKLDVIDSFQFLSTLLEKCVNNLTKEGLEKFKHLRNNIAT